jgi:PST family polysaccharide transporter
VHFIISVILARLLFPKDFGLIGMITVFTGFAGMFASLGFTGAIIQKHFVEDIHLSSCFWIEVGIGVFLAATLSACAPLISSFYSEPRLKRLILLISVTFILNSFALVHRAMLYRQMQFRKLAYIELAAIIIAGIISISMAYLGFEVWSLVWQAVFVSAIGTVLLWIKSNWRPRLLLRPGGL